MRKTADTELDVLSLVPTVKELALDVIRFEPAGVVGRSQGITATRPLRAEADPEADNKAPSSRNPQHRALPLDPNKLSSRDILLCVSLEPAAP